MSFSVSSARGARRSAALAALLVAAMPSLETAAQTVDSSMSFFITGRAIGQGGNLGGLSGADAHCQALADSVGAGMKVWRAYLSTQASGNAAAVNARDRIGAGPWFNANKVKVASNVAELHDTANVTTVTSAKGLTHRGATVASNRHDVMTGSRFNGMAPATGADSTCSNWTSGAAGTGGTLVGHHNRSGIPQNMISNSWNQAHMTTGCSQANVEAGGGSGFFYCFALSTPTGLRPEAERKIGEGASRAPYLLTDGARQDEIVYRFELKSPARVEVSVHDLDGSRRAVLAKGLHRAGKHAVTWDGTSSSGLPLPAGLYVIALKREGQVGN